MVQLRILCLSLLALLSPLSSAEYLPYGARPPPNLGVHVDHRGGRNVHLEGADCYAQTVYETVYRTKTKRIPLHTAVHPLKKPHRPRGYHGPRVITETVYDTEYVTLDNFDDYAKTATKIVTETQYEKILATETVTEIVYKTKLANSPYLDAHPPVYVAGQGSEGILGLGFDGGKVNLNFVQNLGNLKDFAFEVHPSEVKNNDVLKTIQALKSESGFGDEDLTFGDFKFNSEFSDYDFYDGEAKKPLLLPSAHLTEQGVFGGQTPSDFDFHVETKDALHPDSEGHLVTEYSLDTTPSLHEVADNLDLAEVALKTGDIKSDAVIVDVPKTNLELDQINPFAEDSSIHEPHLKPQIINFEANDFSDFITHSLFDFPSDVNKKISPETVKVIDQPLAIHEDVIVPTQDLTTTVDLTPTVDLAQTVELAPTVDLGTTVDLAPTVDLASPVKLTPSDHVDVPPIGKNTKIHSVQSVELKFAHPVVGGNNGLAVINADNLISPEGVVTKLGEDKETVVQLNEDLHPNVISTLGYIKSTEPHPITENLEHVPANKEVSHIESLNNANLNDISTQAELHQNGFISSIHQTPHHQPQLPQQSHDLGNVKTFFDFSNLALNGKEFELLNSMKDSGGFDSNPIHNLNSHQSHFGPHLHETRNAQIHPEHSTLLAPHEAHQEFFSHVPHQSGFQFHTQDEAVQQHTLIPNENLHGHVVPNAKSGGVKSVSGGVVVDFSQMGPEKSVSIDFNKKDTQSHFEVKDISEAKIKPSKEEIPLASVTRDTRAPRHHPISHIVHVRKKTRVPRDGKDQHRGTILRYDSITRDFHEVKNKLGDGNTAFFETKARNSDTNHRSSQINGGKTKLHLMNRNG